jgi:UTP--glucose-1-phosphate uridylyltransferase
MPVTVRKAVIPAAGLGTRFLPATKAQQKVMLPVIDTPSIQFVVEEAVRAGLVDILIVTGRGGRSIADHFDRSIELELFLEQKGKTKELEQVRAISEMADIHYIRQKEALGLGHAVSVASEHVGDEPFAVLLGDDLIHPSVPLLSGMIAAFERLHASAVVAAMDVDPQEIRYYGAIEPGPADDPDDHVKRVVSIVEKPQPEEAPSNLAAIGRYVFGPEVFDAIGRVEPGVGGEIQLTDAINLLAKDGAAYAYAFGRGRFDTGNKLDYLKATVELAVEREDIGPAFREWLTGFVGRLGE